MVVVPEGGGACAFASGVDIIKDLKRFFLLLLPNMILPRLEKETAGRSSQRLSSGMGVVMIGGEDFALADGVVADDKGALECPLSVLESPGTAVCGGSLLGGDWGHFGD